MPCTVYNPEVMVSNPCLIELGDCCPSGNKLDLNPKYHVQQIIVIALEITLQRYDIKSSAIHYHIGRPSSRLYTRIDGFEF